MAYRYRAAESTKPSMETDDGESSVEETEDLKPLTLDTICAKLQQPTFIIVMLTKIRRRITARRRRCGSRWRSERTLRHTCPLWRPFQRRGGHWWMGNKLATICGHWELRLKLQNSSITVRYESEKHDKPIRRNHDHRIAVACTKARGPHNSNCCRLQIPLKY